MTYWISTPTGVHRRSATSATSLPMTFSIMRVKSSARCAGSATMSAEPSRALAMPVTSLTSQSVPTPRASQVKRPAQASRVARSTAGSSCSLRPSVSRMPCRMAAEDWRSRPSARRSQVPMAVPPPELRDRRASLAWARVAGSATARRPWPG